MSLLLLRKVVNVSTPVELGPGRFAEHTTLRIGGDVRTWIIARTEDACIEAVVECDDLGDPLVVIGGGSNVVCSDAPFEGTVVQIAPTGISTTDRGGHVRVVAAAGEEWDNLVARTLEAGSAAFAPLSGIPGLVGASPIQNIGAYGVEVSDFIVSVRVWDRIERAVRELSDEECVFGYRTSMFKISVDRFVVLSVTFDLPLDESISVGYAQLASKLGVDVGECVTGTQVRHAVVELRRGKGMLLDPADRDTWSVGSFFVNPVIPQERARALSEECPTFPAKDGIKVSAAWLIDNSGVGCGFQLSESGARVSTKHSLAICNADHATCEDVLELARAMRARVQERFGIELVPEPRLIGCVV